MMSVHLVGLGLRAKWDIDCLEEVPDCVPTLHLLLLDGSGSMAPVAGETRNAVNGYLRTIRESRSARATSLGIWTFATNAREVMPFTKATDAPEFTGYSPEGQTRLYGTVRDALNLLFRIDEAMRAAGKDLRIILTVMTDGGDSPNGDGEPDLNARRELRTLAAIARERGIELKIFGIGISAREIAHEMQFPDDEDHAFSVRKNREGVEKSMLYLARSTITTSQGGFTPRPTPCPPSPR